MGRRLLPNLRRNQARFSGCCPRIHGGIHGCRPPRGLKPYLTRSCSITPTLQKVASLSFPHGSRAKWSSFPQANPTLKVILYLPEQAMEKGSQPAFPSVGGGLQNMVKKMSPLRDLWWIIADSAKTIEHKTSLLN